MLKEDCERIGVLECGAAFQKIGFMFREQPIGDYGIDAIIETRDDKYLSGKLIAVQIKSGDSYFKEQNRNFLLNNDEKQILEKIKFTQSTLQDIKTFNLSIKHAVVVLFTELYK